MLPVNRAARHLDEPYQHPESPILGFTHLQFEAMLTAARESPSSYDFGLVAMLVLLGLRIFEATGADVADLGEGTWPPGPEGAWQGRLV